MRRLLPVLCLLGCLAAPAGASAAGSFFIRGGGDGHGIGMSQYGAYGYALHGKDYRFILAHYYSGSAIGQTDSHQTVRVLLKAGSAAFSGGGSAAGPSGAARPLHPDWTYTVKALSNGELRLLDPSGKPVGRFATPLSVTGTGPLQVAGLGSYRGGLEFRPAGAAVQTVDAVGLDDYVRGVIGAEMPASWPAQALEAQAVAARTYAITTSVAGNGYTLYPDTRSQMYGGVAAETPATDAAVAATAGQVVTYTGAPVVTYFFASSGGYTESVENVWLGAPSEPWLHGVPDPYDGAGGDPYHRWGYDLSIAQASARLGSLLKGRLVGIRVVRHGVSPRILVADVVGTKGTTHLTGSQVQHVFGLPTSFVRFVTLVTLPGRAPGPIVAPVHSGRDAGGLSGFLTLIRAVVTASTPSLHGSVFPIVRGAPLAIQVDSRQGWRTVKQARVAAAGTFALTLPAPGRYRVVYEGLDGPAVTVS